jgi:hypothetical protein
VISNIGNMKRPSQRSATLSFESVILDCVHTGPSVSAYLFRYTCVIHSARDSFPTSSVAVNLAVLL